MKIITRDNLDRDTVNDRLIAEDVHPNAATQIVAELNSLTDVDSVFYYVAVADDYELKVFEP